MAAVKAEFQIYFIYESTLIQCEQITATAYHIKRATVLPTPQWPMGGTDLRFCSPKLQVHGHGGSRLRNVL